MLEIVGRDDYSDGIMTEKNEKIPNPKEIEKELSEFIAKKFGSSIKIAAPIAMPQVEDSDSIETPVKQPADINFNLKPNELIAYLDQFIIKQDTAKAILATKICTHFNRIRYHHTSKYDVGDMVGSIKNNILMIGPTGVGKTYMVRLIAQKIGVPFVKGDATKFSETGYVGGDVEDLVRDLVREADGDIERAQHGIIYIDEIDKISSAQNLIGADVSRTGVQRALLKPMEETEVDLKVPHDPISMLQEIERYRKTGKRDDATVNTKNILFVMSGAFNGLDKIIKKRLSQKTIGFGASFPKNDEETAYLSKVKSEDLIEFGFETEFVGRLPVRAVFERLSEKDLLAILINPNNPIILGKKIDFGAYDIQLKFDKRALHMIAQQAFDENTGARGLVSAVENALLLFEKSLPSTQVKRFAVTEEVLNTPEKYLSELILSSEHTDNSRQFEEISQRERVAIAQYIAENKSHLGDKYSFPLTPSRIEMAASSYGCEIVNIEGALKKIVHLYEQIKTIEMIFFKNHDINIVLDDETIDYIINEWLIHPVDVDAVYKQLSSDLLLGLKLVHEKTGRNRFFITLQAIEAPEEFIRDLLKKGPSDN